MGILSSISSWVGKAIEIVKPVVSAAANFASKAATVVEALMAGKSILDSTKDDRQSRTTTSNRSRPNIMDDEDFHTDEIVEIKQTIEKSKKKMASFSKDNEHDHQKIKLQIDIMELIISSSTFQRFSNNISIHASNLQIHLHNIQNTAGILDDVNHQRVAIKALIGTVNHLINVTGNKDSVRKLEGLEIDRKPGAVSIKSSYDAFESTRAMLLEETIQFTSHIDDQLKRVEGVRVAAAKLPNNSKQVSDWLHNSVEPKLLEAQKSAESLRGDLLMIPTMENALRQRLSKPDFEGEEI